MFSLLCYWSVSCCCLCDLCFSCCVIGWSRAAVYVLCVFLAVSLVGLVLLSMCFVFSLLCHWLVSCCCLCALCFPCCVIGWSRAAVYVLCVFLAVSLVGVVLLSMCCVFLAVSLVGLVLLSMCFVFSLLCHWLVSCCCLCALCFPGCVIGWSRAAVYVLCVFLAVSLVGLVLLSMCFVFSWLCHWLVSCCCLCALCFPGCVIGWSRADVYVLCVFLAVSLVGLVLMSMCFVFSLLCHRLVSCCCLCALCFPCCVISWSRAAVYVLCVFLAVSLVGLVLLSMCCVFLAVSLVGLVLMCMCFGFSCCAIGWSLIFDLASSGHTHMFKGHFCHMICHNTYISSASLKMNPYIRDVLHTFIKVRSKPRPYTHRLGGPTSASSNNGVSLLTFRDDKHESP